MKKSVRDNSPPAIKFPVKCRTFEPELRERGFPPVAFQLKKLDLKNHLTPLEYQVANRTPIKITVPQQTRALTALTKRLFKPRLVIIGTEPGGLGYPEATQLVLWLALQAYQHRSQAQERTPLWYPIYNNRDRRLLERHQDDFAQQLTGFESPSLLVLDNLYPNSSALILNKTQEIVNKWRYQIPVFIIVSGTTSLAFGFEKLHIQANYYLQLGSGRRVVAI